MKKVVLSLFLLVAQVGNAGLLELKPGVKSIQDVKLSESAIYKTATETVSLKMVGAGLRKKKVAFVKANVYVAQIFLDSPEKFVRTEQQALKTAASSRISAVQLTFLRDVEVSKILESFVEAFKLNQIDLESNEIKAFLAAFKAGGDAKNKSAITIVNVKEADGSETIRIESSAGKITDVKGGAGFGEKTLTILFGVAKEKEVIELRNQILTFK